jgi:hypothetical protein
VLRGVRLATGYTGLAVTSTLDPADPVTQRIAGVAWRETSNGWMPVPDAMPRARLLTVARASRAITDDVHGADIAQVAIVDRSIAGLSGSPGSARVVSDRPGAVVVETSAPGRQLLTLTERFHRGWYAAVDGRPEDAIPVYGDFLGAVVEGGRHSVTFTFNPVSARRGWQLTLAGVVLTGIGSVLLWPRSHRPSRERGAIGEPRDGAFPRDFHGA